MRTLLQRYLQNEKNNKLNYFYLVYKTGSYFEPIYVRKMEKGGKDT